MKEKVDQLLKEAGAILIRDKNHEIWRLPNGKNFVRPKTPSDTKGFQNSYSDLKKLLGLNLEHHEGERREKKRTNGKDTTIHYQKPKKPVQISINNLAIDLWKEKAEFLESQNALLVEELSHLCWWCKLMNWWNGK